MLTPCQAEISQNYRFSETEINKSEATLPVRKHVKRIGGGLDEGGRLIFLLRTRCYFHELVNPFEQ